MCKNITLVQNVMQNIMDNNIEVDSWKKSRTTMIPKVKKSTAAQLRPIGLDKDAQGFFKLFIVTF